MRNAEDDKIRFDASALAFSYLDGIDSGIVSAGGSRLRTWLIPAVRSFPVLYLAIRCTVAFYRSSRQRGMARTQKIIITCAITGAIHTPSMSPSLPVTPDQITEASVGAAKAGAAILHLHARNLKTGKPDQSPAAFAAFLPRIKQATDAVVNLTSGGAPYMRIEERIQPAITFMPELASLNLGSINLGIFPLLAPFTASQYSSQLHSLDTTRNPP